MSERYPLLYDDLSEDERYSHSFRRLSMSRERARNSVKGALTIITRLPEHWTTLLLYWWIGLGMIAITTFILYNILFTYAMLPPAKPAKSTLNNIHSIEHRNKQHLYPNVFMHIFVEHNQEVDLNKYLPYIEIVTNRYQDFKYELLIVLNDTHMERNSISEEENNDLAKKNLWDDDNKIITQKNDNLIVKRISLANYLNDSPLKKHWNEIPKQITKFLVRAVSVWEKGGIAFDPILLTPKSPHSAYINKIQNILTKYKWKENILKTSNQNKVIKIKKEPKTKKVNNIRDIINGLENDNVSEQPYELETLAEAESKIDFNTGNKRKLLSLMPLNNPLIESKSNTLPVHNVISADLNKNLTDNPQIETDKEISKAEDTSKHNLLPFFMDYLFHNKLSQNEAGTTTDGDKIQKSNAPTINQDNNSLEMREFWSDKKSHNNIKPIITNAQGIYNKSNIISSADVRIQGKDTFDVTIDLKGNIIATETACHAFIGNMFTNALHHDHSENVTEFIIKELTIFCNGVLTSCIGIDVILM